MRTQKGRGERPVRALLSGLAVGLAAAFMLLAVFAFIMTKKDIAAERLPFFLLAAGGIGTLFGAFFTAKRLKMRGIAAGLLSALCFSAVYVTLCFALGGFHVSAVLAAMLPVNAAAGLIGGILAKNLGR